MKTLLNRGYDQSVGMLVTPLLNVDMDGLVSSGIPWAVDNGAFSGFDPRKFRLFLARIKGRPGCLFVVCPDVVADAKSTLAMYREWEGEVLCNGHPVAFVLQDGQEDLELPEADAYFVGGSTQFKLSDSASDLIKECKRRGRWVHMGRVNTKRRVKHAHVRGIDSVDGTCMRFAGFGAIVTLCEYAAMLDIIRKVNNGTPHQEVHTGVHSALPRPRQGAHVPVARPTL